VRVAVSEVGGQEYFDILVAEADRRVVPNQALDLAGGEALSSCSSRWRQVAISSPGSRVPAGISTGALDGLRY
jgi:hypothetical protein